MEQNSVSKVYANAKEVCDLLGIVSKNPEHLLRRWVRDQGFPRGGKVGIRREWKVSEVLAWRENQHAISK